MKKTLIVGALIALYVVACSDDEISDRSQFKDPWQKFILKEIDSLTKQNPKLTKTINLGDEVDTKVLDSVNWFNELSGFLAIDFTIPKGMGGYRRIYGNRPSLRFLHSL